MASAPFISVVIPVRNEGRHVARTVSAVLDGEYPPERLEVIVVDGASGDDTRAQVRAIAAHDARVRVLDNPAGRTPVGLNIGVRAARGDVIVRIDAHTLPAADYLTACVRALERAGVWAVGGRMVGAGETPFGRAVAAATGTPFGAGDARFRLGGEGPADTVYLGAWWREVFDRVGLFDERMARNQDYELCVRIRAAGGTVWLDPEIRSITRVRETPAGLARQYFGYGEGRAATVALYPGSLRWRQAMPALFAAALAVGSLGALLVPGLAAWFVAVVAGYAAVTVGVTAWVGRRMTWRDALRLPPVFWIIHLTWGCGFWAAIARYAGRRVGAALRGRPDADNRNEPNRVKPD